MRTLFAAVVTLFITYTVCATTIVMPKDGELVDKSPVIVSGRIIDSYPDLLPDGSIQTVFIMAVEESLRGSRGGELIEFREWGGVVGDRVTTVIGAPAYEIGGDYLVFLRRWGSHLTTVDFAAGKFRYVDRAGVKVLERDLSEVAALTAAGSEHVEVPRPAATFLDFVRDRVGKQRYVGHANTTADPVVRPLSSPLGSLSANTAVSFANSQWNLSSVVNYSISGTADTLGKKDLDDGIDVVVYDSASCNTPDGGTHCIAGSFTGSGVVATAFYSGFVLSDRLDITESDIVIQDGINDSNTTQTQLNLIMTHEIGHTLGFRHPDQNKNNTGSCASPLPCSACNNSTDKAVMCSFVQSGLNGSLQSWDVAGRANNYTSAASFDDDYLTWHSGVNKPWRRQSPTTAWRISSLLADSCTGPSISSGPTALPAAIQAGEASDLSVVGAGDPTLAYQWYVGVSGVTSHPVPGGDLSSITVVPNATTSYWVRISNACGSIDSGEVSVTVTRPVDFGGDGKTDIIWRNLGTGANAIWSMDGATQLSSSLINPLTNLVWELKGAGDFNSDGMPDLVWRNLTDGRNAVWFMNGLTFLESKYLEPLALQWDLVAVNDFNEDGDADLIWRNQDDGRNAIWVMDGVTRIDSYYLKPIPDSNWNLVGSGDFDGDGDPDLAWRNTNDGRNAIWFMDGTTRVGSQYVRQVSDLSWRIAGAGDLDGDGKADLIWRNMSGGDNAIWFMDGASRLASSYTKAVGDQDWQIVGPR